MQTDLHSLAARAEAAEGPDRELDALVWCAVCPPDTQETLDDWHAGRPRPPSADSMGLTLPEWLERWPEHLTGTADAYRVPRYTASLDAALTLLPEAEAGFSAVFWRLGNDGEGGNPADFKAEVLVCAMLSSQRFTATASTPALALVAACLKARATQGENDG